MNMNRQSGRRRGRGGNNRPQNNGGGRGSDPQNRIDNRTRGNAAQLLEKYKGLARDAQMAGDRVSTEYFLQFADHYFRVLADAQARREEHQAQNGAQNGDRQQRWRENAPGDDFIEGVEDMDFGLESDAVDASRSRNRDDSDEGAAEASEERVERPERAPRGNRSDRNGTRDRGGERGNERGAERSAGGSYRSYRENQGRDRAPANDRADGDSDEGGFDQSILPPAISAVEEEKPKVRRPRARKTADDDSTDVAAE